MCDWCVWSMCVIDVWLSRDWCVIDVWLMCDWVGIDVWFMCDLCVIDLCDWCVWLLCHCCVIVVSLLCHCCVIDLWSICVIDVWSLCVIDVWLMCDLCVIYVWFMCDLCVMYGHVQAVHPTVGSATRPGSGRALQSNPPHARWGVPGATGRGQEQAVRLCKSDPSGVRLAGAGASHWSHAQYILSVCHPIGRTLDEEFRARPGWRRCVPFAYMDPIPVASASLAQVRPIRLCGSDPSGVRLAGAGVSHSLMWIWSQWRPPRWRRCVPFAYVDPIPVASASLAQVCPIRLQWFRGW
jgi:hypothetical protein